MNQNEAKLLFRGHCLLHARRRFIGAMVPEAPLDHDGLGLTKPTTFLRLDPVPRPRKSMHWATRGVPRVARTIA